LICLGLIESHKWHLGVRKCDSHKLQIIGLALNALMHAQCCRWSQGSCSKLVLNLMLACSTCMSFKCKFNHLGSTHDGNAKHEDVWRVSSKLLFQGVRNNGTWKHKPRVGWFGSKLILDPNETFHNLLPLIQLIQEI